MAARDKIMRVHCGYEGCNETGFYSYNNRKEGNDLFSRYGLGKWKCVRHTNPDSTLSIKNNKIITNLIAGKSKTYPDLTTLFWNDESGITYGDGYRAFANDFPEGTILRITAEIIIK